MCKRTVISLNKLYMFMSGYTEFSKSYLTNDPCLYLYEGVDTMTQDLALCYLQKDYRLRYFFSEQFNIYNNAVECIDDHLLETSVFMFRLLLLEPLNLATVTVQSIYKLYK